MGLNFKKLTAAASAAAICAATSSVPVNTVTSSTLTASAASAFSSNVLEYLDRGISAVNTGSGMLVSWRWLTNDDDNAVFKLYRDGSLIYTSNSGDATCYLDAGGKSTSIYRVDYLVGNTVKSSETCSLISNNAYFDIPLSPPSSIYSPNDMSVGDVDGDGQYELFLKWDPNNSKDNSQSGTTGNVYIDCYKLDGTRLWRIDLGKNIRAGAHYTQFYVADFDLDGKAEMTCKTADGTVDGVGKVIGDSSADYRNSSGFIITGPEYYTLFDGETGAALDTVNYEIARGTTTAWGKSSDKTNRVDRFWGTVAYLDGVHPCIVNGRGYYGRMTATAWKVENKKLVKMWTFDTGTSTSAAGYGCGNHNSMPADVDGDGKQEVITGASVIDDDGTLYYTTSQGHGDAMHVADLDPTNPGIEAWICHEDSKAGYGVSLLDLDQKKILYHQNGAGDTGRCCADNVWAGNPGAECWGNKTSDGSTPVVDVNGNTLSCRRPAINFLTYWDGDLEREILDACNSDTDVGVSDDKGNALIYKMNSDGNGFTNLLQTTGYYVNNTTKATPCLSADIFGDWREELIVRAADSKSIRIFCTTYDTDYRITTLMHDPQYRMQVSAQNTAYNQPPHPSFFLGTGYSMPERNGCEVNGAVAGKKGAVIDTTHYYKIKNVNSGLYLEVNGDAANGTKLTQGNNEDSDIWILESAGSGYYYLYTNLSGGNTHCLDVPYGSADNGTEIGIWNNDNSEARMIKFVDNGDGTYTMCTRVSGDDSCLGVLAGSKDSGASIVEWECNGSDDQKWVLEIKVMPKDGTLFKQLLVNDTANYQDWKIAPTISEGEAIFGDRDVTYASLPAEFNGCESILTACDSKGFAADQATFVAGADMYAYVLLDKRVETNATVPSWLSSWTKTDMTAQSSNDVTFIVYKKLLSEGESVTLGVNCTTTNSVVNYTVFGKALPASGKLITQLDVLDNANASDWSIRSTVGVGSDVYGDRTFTYTALSDTLIGAEYIAAACDSKNSASDLATFIAGADATIYVAVDERVAAVPSFLSGWTLTSETAQSSNDVNYVVYSKSVKAGETVTLGTNGQSSGCVGYTVFAVADQSVVTTTTTSAPQDNRIYGDANCNGIVEMADAVILLQSISNPDRYGLTGYDNDHITEQGHDNADVNARGDGLTSMDALSIQRSLLKLIDSLPESYK